MHTLNKTAAEEEEWFQAVLPNPFIPSSEAGNAAKSFSNLAEGLSDDSKDDYHSLTAEDIDPQTRDNEFRQDINSPFEDIEKILAPHNQDQPVIGINADSENTPKLETATQDFSPDPLFDAKRDNAAHLRGIGLLAVIFDELSNQLGKEFTTAELMQAAQRLIDVSKTEYVPNPYKAIVERAGYYSWDLVRAFSSDNPWQIANVEANQIDHCDRDEYSPEALQAAGLIMQGWNEKTWEF